MLSADEASFKLLTEFVNQDEEWIISLTKSYITLSGCTHGFLTHMLNKNAYYFSDSDSDDGTSLDNPSHSKIGNRCFLEYDTTSNTFRDLDPSSMLVKTNCTVLFRKCIESRTVEFCDYTNKSGESNITPTYSPLLNGMCIPIYIDELPVFAVITLLNINFETKYDIVQKLEPLISVSQNLFAMYDTCHLAKRSAELLDKRAEEQKQLANAKTAFLANMSHEIRTPLNGIIGMTSVLKNKGLNVQQEEYINIIEQCGYQLLTVLNDILDYSKMAANRVQLNKTQANLRTILENTYDVVGMHAAIKEIAISYTFDGDVPLEVIVDKKRLQQILVNLLSNAVKYTKKGSILTTVSSQQNSDTKKHTIYFTVKDTGIGISPEDQERVFRSFEQSGEELGGAGLGLPISCKLAEMMGGNITLFSEGINKGSCFELRIQAEAAQNDHLLPRMFETTLKGKCALLVDDKHINRMVLANLVMNWGMHPLVASSVDEALMYVNSNSHIDIAFLDIRLPTMSGFELAGMIKERRPQLPMVALSSIGEHYPSPTARTPFQAYMLKPIKQEKLFNICVGIFTTKRPRSAYESSKGNRDFFPLNILLIEDSIPNRQVALAVLAELNYNNVVTCNDGLDAVQKVKNQNTDFDIIFMDIRMPLLDGYGATQKIKDFYKTTPEGRRCPYIVAMTACVLQEDRDKAKKVGMDAFLPKPITVSDVKDILDVAKRSQDEE